MIRKAPISMIMTRNVITLNRDDSLEKAERLFKHYGIRHIPVVSNKTIVGMLSYSDLLRLSFADIAEAQDSAVDVMIYNMFTVNQVMTKNVICVSPSASIKEVSGILVKEEFHALPVVNHNQLIGIVTTTDLISYLQKQF
ncbi:hypothetical protein MHTCC0001_03380 [Flavobacteriaceae bacterium MHTCC 0001]